MAFGLSVRQALQSEAVAVTLISFIVVALGIARASMLSEPSCECGHLCQPFEMIDGNAFAYTLLVPYVSADDAEARNSPLILYEDGKPLGPAHTDVDEIVKQGSGRYLYWRSSMKTTLYMSTSDNTDPNTNGRRYTFSAPTITSGAEPE